METEERLRNIEGQLAFHQANAIALQTVLIAAIKAINRNPASRDAFVSIFKAAAEGSFDHAIGTTMTDQVIALSRRQMAAFVGKEIAAAAGLP